MTQSAPRDDQKLQITLLQERSAGTFARVYLAEARGAGGLSRVVAVKVIKEQWSESHEILTRTRDEARLLARLQHKNILRVEALAEVDGQPAIVMEFVDGIDLLQLIERLGAASRRIPRRALFTIMAEASSAVAAAWEQIPLNGSGPLRVVHRDIKPSNVMVSKQGEVKVLDFGTARFDFTERQARTGALRFGSLKYMSPERRRGDRGDHPSDVYALGLLCIEMLQGQLLPLLPLDITEHDQQLASCIAHLSDLGLPDSRWDQAARQTLSRMIASDPSQRLLASQIIPLFRAFADSATGESLDAFSADTVAALTRDVYGGQTGPDLSGSRIFVAMTTSSDLPVSEASPAASPEASPAASPAASPGFVAPSVAPDDPGWTEPATTASDLAAPPGTQAPGPLPVTVAPAPAPAPAPRTDGGTVP
ncbi:MAG: serine/threonine protein kinase, partial [Oligoflexia bacterium]|nr:serine/threonine protein kinase [Oligoflexia bacterium]